MSDCETGCQYAKDVGMFPYYSCGNGCIYAAMREQEAKEKAPEGASSGGDGSLVD